MGVFLQEKAVPKEVGGPQAPSSENPNFPLERENPRCI
jgi:hypothetical protein